METSKVYSASTVEKDQKLYQLTQRMQKQAKLVQVLSQDPQVSISRAEALADTVLEFLQVSGWSRP